MENLRLSSMDEDTLDEEEMDTNSPPANGSANNSDSSQSQNHRRNARLRRSRKGKTVDVELPNSSEFTKDLVKYWIILRLFH